MQEWPQERRDNPSLEERYGLLDYRVRVLCADLQESQAKLDGIGDLLRDAVEQAREDKRELLAKIEANHKMMQDTKDALHAHEVRAESTLKTVETMGAVRKMLMFIFGSIIGLAAGIAAIAQLLAFWKTQ